VVSRYGLVAFASSLDQIGPFTRTVEDAALVLSVLSGHDARDSTSSPVPAFDASKINGDVKGLRIGLPKEYFIKGTDTEVEKSVREAVRTLESQGAKVVDISLPHTSYAVGTYYIIAPSEASSNLARFDGVRFGYSSERAVSLEDLYELSRGEGFGPEVKRRIMLGTYALSSGYYDAYYGKAQRVRTLISDDFKKAFQKCDVIAAPTAPTPAFRFGEKSGDPMAMYLSDIFTIPSNMAGNASVSIPCGLSSKGLPIGLQLIADVFREDVLLKTAQAYEKVKPFASCPL
jgi:aspartyl-tRNA(Asn)/glutamyl-tRNA(Gln) amidotransferase subunit A